MPLGYGYVKREANDYINWAEVGKGVSDTFAAINKEREDKKAAIDKATREFQQKLENAPQGKFQDANKFTNDYAHSMMQQMMMDTKLLKSGQMKLQDFTLRRQNYVDGTSTLFDLQKFYQQEYDKKMQGIQSGELQALTGANMASVEGFADFTKSKAVINPQTGIVNVGIMKPNPVTGVLELTDDVTPVGVIKGKILTDIPAWKADDAMNNTIKNMGDIKNAIYSAASQTKQGTVTSFLGLSINEGSKDPKVKAIVDNANKALDYTIDSYFSNKYNLSSALTQNTGKYNQESFTYNKDEAAKDPSKILLKIDTATGLPIMDETGPNYKNQEAEARQWVRTQMLSKMDNEKTVTSTGTTQYAPDYVYSRGERDKENINTATMIGTLWGGESGADIQKATTAFRDINPNVQSVERTPTGVNVTLKGPDGKIQTRTLPFYGSDGKLMSQRQFILSAAPLLGGNADWKTAIDRGGFRKGAKFNEEATEVSAVGGTTQGDYSTAVSQYAKENVSSSIVEDNPVETQNNLIKKFGPLGFSFKGRSSGMFNQDDYIDIVDPTGTKSTFKIDNADDVLAIEDLLSKKFDTKAAEQVFGKQSPTPKGPVNPNGVGSNY